jgi:hypothetical protein
MIEKILKDYLKSGGFDGFTNGDECHCDFDNLTDCYDISAKCVPGYKRLKDDGSFYIQTEKDKYEMDKEKIIDKIRKIMHPMEGLKSRSLKELEVILEELEG